jgi:hypothetical protein
MRICDQWSKNFPRLEFEPICLPSTVSVYGPPLLFLAPQLHNIDFDAVPVPDPDPSLEFMRIRIWLFTLMLIRIWIRLPKICGAGSATPGKSLAWFPLLLTVLYLYIQIHPLRLS